MNVGRRPAVITGFVAGRLTALYHFFALALSFPLYHPHSFHISFNNISTYATEADAHATS